MANITWQFRHVKLLSIFGLAACAFNANAAPAASGEAKLASAPERQLWITSGFASHHLERRQDYNENNHGIGAEWHLDDDEAIALGTYRNSVREQSNYLQYMWTPLTLGAFKLGGAVGLLDGYPELNDGNVALSLIPVVSLHFKVLGHDAGLNFVYIPTIADQVDGAVAVQLKVRAF